MSDEHPIEYRGIKILRDWTVPLAHRPYYYAPDYNDGSPDALGALCRGTSELEHLLDAIDELFPHPLCNWADCMRPVVATLVVLVGQTKGARLPGLDPDAVREALVAQDLDRCERPSTTALCPCDKQPCKNKRAADTLRKNR